MWQPEEKEILGLFRQDWVLTSVLGVLSLLRCRGRTGVSNSTSPRFSHVFCGSSMMSESCKLAVDAVSKEFVLRVLFESQQLRVTVEPLVEPPSEPTCPAEEGVFEFRLTVRDDNCSSELASERLDSEKLSLREIPTISVSLGSCALFLHREGVSPEGVMTS